MSNDFERIPDIVWKLFDEIMWVTYRRRTGPKWPEPLEGGPVKLLTGIERSNAEIIALGWDPPLLELGNLNQLTLHGLAAYAWHEDRMESDDDDEILPNETKVKEKDVPCAYRDLGEPDGPILTVKYLEGNKQQWDLKGPYLTKHFGKELTNRIKVGQSYAYRFKELAHLKTLKTAQKRT